MPSEITNSAEHHHPVTIIVNGRPREVTKRELTYEKVVDLAFDDHPPTGPNVLITVTYSKGADGAKGSLRPGQEVRDKEGMVFNVKATDKS